MKKRIITLLTIVLAVSCCQNTAQSRNHNSSTLIIVGISPFQETSTILTKQKKPGEALQVVLNIVTSEMNSGDELSLIDTDNLREVAYFKYPDNITLTSKLRKQYISDQLRKILIYYKDKKPENTSGNLNLPRFFKLLKDRISIIENKKIEIVLIGSPIYKSKNPKFDFGSGWLSDAAFVMDTPFKVDRENAKVFRNIKFHMIFTKDPFKNLKHREGVERFWGLFISLHGGELITFTPDIKAYERIKEDLQSQFYTIDHTDTEFLVLHEPDRHPKTIKKKRKIKRYKQNDTLISNINIQTTWETTNGSSADIDTYLLIKPKAITVNWKNRYYQEGIQKAFFSKDFETNISGVKNGFEHIHINNLDLKNVELWLNNFSNYPKRLIVRGQIKIIIDNNNCPYYIPFEITQQSKGNDFKNRYRSKAWKEINLYQFIQSQAIAMQED